mmetsp:Transcript_56313/g.131972  ORF Transcript_56313/g.131972 Transcript_56313/m.131972 type:complete len:480 (+) Transcript_56313:58-1497(+)
MGHCVRHLTNEIGDLLNPSDINALPVGLTVPKLSSRRGFALAGPHLGQDHRLNEFLFPSAGTLTSSSSTAAATSFVCARNPFGPSTHCCEVGNQSGAGGTVCATGFGKCPRDLQEVSGFEQAKHPRTYCGRVPNHSAKCTLSRKMKTSEQIKKIEEKCGDGFHGFMEMCGKKANEVFKREHEGTMAVCCHRAEGMGLTGVTCELKEMPHGAEQVTTRLKEGLQSQFTNPCPPQLQNQISKKGQKIAVQMGRSLSAATSGVSEIVAEFLKKLLQMQEYYLDQYFVLNPKAYLGLFGMGSARTPQVKCISNSLVAKVLTVGKKFPGVTVDKETMMTAMGKSQEAKTAQKKLLKEYPHLFKSAVLLEMKDKIQNHPTPFDKMKGLGPVKTAIEKFRHASGEVMYKFFDTLLSFEKAAKLKAVVSKNDPNCPPEWKDLPTAKRMYLYLRGEFNKAGKTAKTDTKLAAKEATTAGINEATSAVP